MTEKQAKSELEAIYMSLSEEKKKALDVAFKAMEQADNIPVMYYPQVDGITPTVVAQADGEKVFKMRDATPEEREAIDKYIKSISKPTGVNFWDLADGEYISREAVMDCYKKWQPYMATRLHEFEKELSELPSVAIPPDHDGCKDCKYETYPEYYYPCCECKQNYTDEWQKKPHWIYDESINNWICSECKETPKTIGYVGTAEFMTEHFKYCNHCGAKMD